MYHPTRGGVRGGRDQFSWEDVKADKHRENYIGHSLKAPVGRWQKGKDLHWYARDKTSEAADMEAAREEIKRIKEQEEQAMREALGLAPKRANKNLGSRLDKQELKELVKRGSTAEDLGGGHAEAARVDGLGFSRLPRPWEESNSVQPSQLEVSAGIEKVVAPAPAPAPDSSARKADSSEESEDERSRKKRRREEKKREKHEKREKRHTRDSEDKKHRKHKGKKRHDSESD
ncbi:multiple myeloma tumor-associated protein 2 homolog [Rhodamnia argentea]|uniref:Multiple myeloma tumor-associated protein 2 homolog n=1 Tax=Rhodamnia argentea TaxID=178133 RepID=A0A8B8QXV9_9MYRT|nr:multiple myeloma tumor-associated protein 2 homolog [Rhodamnia argentea]